MREGVGDYGTNGVTAENSRESQGEDGGNTERWLDIGTERLETSKGTRMDGSRTEDRQMIERCGGGWMGRASRCELEGEQWGER